MGAGWPGCAHRCCQARPVRDRLGWSSRGPLGGRSRRMGARGPGSCLWCRRRLPPRGRLSLIQQDSHLTDSLVAPTGHPRLVPARLRSTWLLWHLTGRNAPSRALPSRRAEAIERLQRPRRVRGTSPATKRRPSCSEAVRQQTLSCPPRRGRVALYSGVLGDQQEPPRLGSRGAPRLRGGTPPAPEPRRPPRRRACQGPPTPPLGSHRPGVTNAVRNDNRAA